MDGRGMWMSYFERVKQGTPINIFMNRTATGHESVAIHIHYLMDHPRGGVYRDCSVSGR